MSYYQFQERLGRKGNDCVVFPYSVSLSPQSVVVIFPYSKGAPAWPSSRVYHRAQALHLPRSRRYQSRGKKAYLWIVKTAVCHEPAWSKHTRAPAAHACANTHAHRQNSPSKAVSKLISLLLVLPPVLCHSPPAPPATPHPPKKIQRKEKCQNIQLSKEKTKSLSPEW